VETIRKAAAFHVTRVYTVGLQYAITKYWQKAVCPTNQTVMYCSFSCIIVSRLIKVQQGVKLYQKSLEGPWTPQPPSKWRPRNEWGSTLSFFCLHCNLFRTASSCHGKRGCYMPAKMLLLNTHITPLH